MAVQLGGPVRSLSQAPALFVRDLSKRHRLRSHTCIYKDIETLTIDDCTSSSFLILHHRQLLSTFKRRETSFRHIYNSPVSG
jgi:hypothetical protein